MTSDKYKKKMILFGAGKIGRSFIGQLFSRGNYEVVFVDISKDIINELNKRNNYNVVIKSENEEVLNIKNVRGVWAGDERKIVDEIADASIAAVSVGLNGLKSVIPIIAKGLLEYNRPYGPEWLLTGEAFIYDPESLSLEGCGKKCLKSNT